MSIGSVFAGLLRSLFVVTATAGAALGLLAVFHPFAPAATSITVAVDTRDADALRSRIDATRRSLAETEAALDNVKSTALVVTPSNPDDTMRAQYEAQIASATERRDLARRHAAAIRDGLDTGLPVTSLAGIRDSVVVGQLLSQQAALEGQIAEQGARFQPSHPVMRALLAQRTALNTQIRSQAGSIAAALESEADLDDKQIRLLQSQLTPVSAAATSQADDGSLMRAKAAAQRAELDALMDAYFRLAPAAGQSSRPADLLSPLNLFVVVIAALAALVFQIALAGRRRRYRDDAADLAAWQDDVEPELPFDEAVPAADAAAPLRRAS